MDDLLDLLIDQAQEAQASEDLDTVMSYLDYLVVTLNELRGIDRPSPWCDCCPNVEDYLIEHVMLPSYPQIYESAEALYEAVSSAWDSEKVQFQVSLSDVRAFMLRHHIILQTLETDNQIVEDDESLPEIFLVDTTVYTH